MQESIAGAEHEAQIYQIKQKYSSINSLARNEKINAVKDTSLNPFLFEDPFDGLTNSLSHWQQAASSLLGKSEGEKREAASQYYDNVLAPMYQRMKAPPLSKKIWMIQAYGQALKYDPAQSYHSPFVHGLIESIPGVIAPAARAASFISNVLGLPLVSIADSVKNKDYSGLTGFYNLYMNMHNRVAKDGVFKAIEETGEKAPILGALSKYNKGIADYTSFWHDVTPNRTFTEKVTSFVAENALLLPMFMGVSQATELGIGLVKAGAEGVPIIGNLTETLGATKSGQIASRLLTYGTEGLTWGTLTRETGDKQNAWQDALSFAAMGTLFSFKGKSGKLGDILPEGVEKDAFKEREQTHALAIQGFRPANAEEYLQAHRKQMSGNIAAGGITLQHAILQESLDHIAAWGEWSNEPEAKAFMKKAEAKDPAHWKPVFSGLTLIMSYLKSKGLSTEIVKNPEAHEKEFLGLINFLHEQVNQAAEELNKNVPDMQEAAATKMAGDSAKTEQGQAEYKQVFEAELAKAQVLYKDISDGVKKAQAVAKKNAEKIIVKRRMEFIKKAEEAKNETGPTKAEAPKAEAPLAEANFDWNKAASSLAEKRGWKKSTKANDAFWEEFANFHEGSIEGEVKGFAHDMYKYFNPLKKAGLHFEKGEAQGGDYTNFLGFLYHYREQLPKPVFKKLEELLVESPKMKAILGAKITPDKLEHFGLAMNNHVDMFMRSTWYRDLGEKNIFRSTQPTLRNKTTWQVDLVKNTWDRDIKLADKYYPGDSQVTKDAKTQYITAINSFYSQQMQAAMSGKEKLLALSIKMVREFKRREGVN
jgi:hypothetical protein